MTRLELRGLVSGLMLDTAANLRDRNIDIALRIHDSRKRFKEVRALLRLFRDQLGEQFRDENLWYRDAAREFADYRDADTAVAALDHLPELPPATVGRLRRLIRGERRLAYRDVEAAEATLEKVAAALADAVERLPDLSGSVKAGFNRTLRTGRRAMREAYESENAIAFHEWRKRVKDHWYQVRFLAIPKTEKRLIELARILGHHHDLEVVRGVVTAAETVFSQEEAAVIDKALRKRQRRLATKAKAIGEKIYR